MRPLRVDDADRAAYHAAASVAANYLLAVEDLADRIAVGVGLDRAALAPLVRAAVDGWQDHGAPAALTGPAGISGTVIPATVPGTPTIGTATAGAVSAVVKWSAPSSNGGSAITGYVVTPYVSNVAQNPVSVSGTGTQTTVTGLTAGTAYTFRVAAANVMGAGLPGGASLMEDYTYDLVPGNERILGAHMLEVSPSLTTSKPRLEVHPLGIGGKDDPVRLVFTADSGEAVVVALSDTRDGFRLTANVVDVVPPTEALPKLPVGRAVWEPRPSFPVAAEAWLTAGAAHHTVMTTAVGLQVVEDLATMLGTEFLVIDEHTTARGFRDELRLQQTWHRLDRGF